MRKNYLISKRGVSLITVLMFMLVATIAATATWKFITSEGFSSTSRMLKREAYQSAQAGIENARSWMTFHANDVGALIKQFKSNGKPISLDNQLRPLQKAGQNYHVWLTAVNTETSTYKLKLLSSGEARNNTRHTEAVILNVDGLYRVQLPISQSSYSFAEAFHGEMKSIDKLDIDKAVITQTPDVKNSGGQALNDIVVTDYLIMDGSFYANNTNSIKDLYVTGGVGSCSGINVSGNVYVGGVFYTGNVRSKIEGSLYTEGGINLKETYPYTALTGGCGSATVGSAEIMGNITSNGPFIYYDANGSNTFWAKSSMVLNSKMVFPTYFPSSHVQDKVKIDHNVYVKEDSDGKIGDKEVTCGWKTVNDGRDAIPRTKFGSGAEDKIWMKGFVHYAKGATPASFNVCSSDVSTTSCEVDGYTCAKSSGNRKWIGFKGTFLDSEPSAEDMASWNANKMEKYSEKLAEKDETCKTAKTPIQINTSIFNLGLTHSKNTPLGCSETIWSEWDNTSALMNECYQTAKSNGQLYNNDWLILEFDAPVGWQNHKMNDALIGNFIIKINATTTAHIVKLPETSGSSKVMLYLPGGWPGDSDPIEFVNKTGNYRYFLFSEGDIKRFDMNGQESPMSGSIVMAKCSRFNTGGNNSIKIRFDQELTDDLADASIICDNDGSNTCDAIGGSAGSSSSSSSDDGRYDPYYISMAPQLGVSLESQNKSFENVETLQNTNGSEKLDSSFIILPRVISLPNDPYGTLGDYINVIALNSHAPLTKAKLSLASSCTKVNGFATLDISSLNSKLFSPERSRLTKGTYKCEIAADGYSKTVPIWVAIDNKELRNLHQISFAAPSQEITSNGTKDIYIRLQPNIPHITVNVSCPTPPVNWEYVGSSETTGETCSFDVSNPLYTEKLIKLFSVKTTGATSGTMSFQILEGNDYIATDPSTTGVFIASTGSLYRDPATFEQIDSICNVTPSICPTEDERYNWPDCQIDADYKWVEPEGDGIGFQVDDPNESWVITSALNTPVKFIDVSNNTDCVPLIPTETCSYSDSKKECSLHASYKQKVNKIKFKFKNVEKGLNPFFTVTRGNDIKTCTYDDNKEHECIVNVYDGGPVSMNIETSYSDNKDFTYWQCDGPSCPDNEKMKTNSFLPFTLSDNETVVTVKFNEIDKHCFFDTFKNSTAACKDIQDEAKEYCIDYCYPASHCESALTTTSFINAKWHLVKGSFNMVDYSNGKITVQKNGDITVMSTINADAGTHGSLKALMHLPKENSQSGFILGSNASATNYIILNMFIEDDLVQAKLCNQSMQLCEQKTFSTTGSEDDMFMIEAEISASDIVVYATKDNETVKSSVKFDLGSWGDDYQGSYVGFRIASPKFKLYGIGWKSKNYECFDTYPTIKCSFAAVAKNGVVPRGVFIKPWVGYSGWEGWNTNRCTEKYYYKGADACGGDEHDYVTCSSDGYNFSATSNGKHGYQDNSGNDILTAKVGLECETGIGSSNTEESMWANDSAHCGVFWTGSQKACTTIEKINEEITLYGSSGEQSVAFKNVVNLREAQVKIVADNPDKSVVRIKLYSEGQGNKLYASEYVTLTEDSRVFDIEDFISESGGFDPGKVKSIHFENVGNSIVTIKNILTLCETAVRVKSCRAEEKVITSTGFFGLFLRQNIRYVELTATINNRYDVENYQVIANKENGTAKIYNFDLKKISTSGKETAIIPISKDAKNIDGALNDWDFSISVSADGETYSDTISCSKAIGKTPVCRIDKPSAINNQEIDLNTIEFKGVIENCENCNYVVSLDGSEQASGSCTDVVGANQRCDIAIGHNKFSSLGEGSYTFKISSPDGFFNDCERTFSIKKTQPPANTLDLRKCDVESIDGSSVTIKTESTGCPDGTDCTYSIYPSANESGSYTDNNTITFSYGGEGPVSHTLTITKNDKSEKCTFIAQYEIPSSSSEESSSSNEPEPEESSSSTSKNVIMTTTNNSVPSETIYIQSGTSISLKGTWTNKYWFPTFKLQCYADKVEEKANITITYGTSTSSNQYYNVLTLSTAFYTETETTFVSKVYVTTDGTNLRCNFTN